MSAERKSRGAGAVGEDLPATAPVSSTLRASTGWSSASANPPAGKVFTEAEIAAAAAEAQRTLREPRYVALAEEEERAQQAAAERRRQREAAAAADSGDAETQKPTEKEPPTVGKVRPVAPGSKEPRPSMLLKPEDAPAAAAPVALPGPPVLDLNQPEKKEKTKEKGEKEATPRAPQSGGAKAKSTGGNATRKTAGGKTKPSSAAKKSSTAGKEVKTGKGTNTTAAPSISSVSSLPAVGEVVKSGSQNLAARAERAVERHKANEVKALRKSVSTLKALLAQYGISSSVVPVLPLEKSSACDYCVLFSGRASVEAHLPHVARALCVAGMRVIYTTTTQAGRGTSEGRGETQENDGQGLPGSAEAEDSSATPAVEVKRRLRNMYCFLVEAVPVSGDAEVVSLHVSLRPGMHDTFYEHYIHYYNSVAEGSGGHDGTAVDLPFPTEAAALTDAQKKRLFYFVLNHLVHEKAAVPQDTASVTLFPAHVDAMRDKIWEDCVGDKPWKIWKLLQGTDETALAAYFGEETMFYFAWMNHYQRWLAAASVVSLVAMGMGYLGGGATAGASPSAAAAAASMIATVNLDTGARAAVAAAKALNNTVLNATAAAAAAASFAVATSSASAEALTVVEDGDVVGAGSMAAEEEGGATSMYGLPLFLLVLILGSVLCIKMWERRCSILYMRLGLFQPSLSGKDEVRPEFKGTRGENPITGETEMQFPGWFRGLVLQPLSWVVIALFAACTILLMVCFVNLEGYTFYDAETGETGFAVIPALRRFSLPGCIFNKTDHPITALIPTILYPALVSALSMAFKALAEKLTDLENYKYRGEYIRALTQKRIVLEFINSYAKLFFLAIVRQRISDLSTSLKLIFCTSVFTRLLADTVIPFMRTHQEQVARRLKQRKSGQKAIADASTEGKGAAAGGALAVHTDSTRHGGSSESALDEFDERLASYEVYSDYIEMAVQFGYIVLFAVAFPLAPLVAFLSNIIEIRSDLFKLCYVVRRPVPRLGLAENRTWVGVFSVMAIASVMTNMILFAVSATPMIARLLPSCFAYQYETRFVESANAMQVFATPVLIRGMGRYAVFDAVVVEHVVLGVAVFLFWRISAFPKQVSVYLEKKHYEKSKAAAAVSGKVKAN